MPIRDFYLGYKKLDLAPPEIITRILIPLPEESDDLKLYKVSKRSHLDISSFTAAVLLRRSGSARARRSPARTACRPDRLGAHRVRRCRAGRDAAGEDRGVSLADVVLHAYVLAGQYTSSDVRTLMEDQFRRAVAAVRTPIPEDADHNTRDFPVRLGQQLLFAYLKGEATLDPGSLLDAFFTAAPAPTRGATLAFAVHGFKDFPDDIAEERVARPILRTLSVPR